MFVGTIGEIAFVGTTVIVATFVFVGTVVLDGKIPFVVIVGTIGKSRLCVCCDCWYCCV